MNFLHERVKKRSSFSLSCHNYIIVTIIMLWSSKPTDPETALGHRSRTFVKMCLIHISKQIPSPSTHILVERVTETDYKLSAGKWSFTQEVYFSSFAQLLTIF